MSSFAVPRLLLAACAALPLWAEAARADSCDDLTRQIAGAIGGKVGKRAGPSIDIRMAGPIKFDVTCRAEPIVQATSAEPAPSATFFRDLSVASEILVGEPAATVEPIIASAYRTALSERRKSFIQQNGWSASCYTDPGSTAMRTLCSVGRIPPG
ncbi:MULTISPECIES: hypothetical protein [Methylobacterium]|jgi:hypothetical protein|uniref:Protein of unassigned function n=1 Tax=Methylobacterium oryzae CBMB20 TaxID=693986 RepID=A0A089NQF9_9HYPH|nr:MULTISPECIES: hypothetical protein [Methylobacterium]AIQ90161.1 protein of unassigned function [Methylobacterium oryzae CBMB20]AWV17670.1 hypothetical protein A3862_20980 [Methylobacterium sp. XJLW]MDH3028630.1 hypothetical protein [Methylobacterium fujisawaense]WFS09931.1 hypothetical protein P9K36_11925 [Methylobacterium sp. 391_Methyba4]